MKCNHGVKGKVFLEVLSQAGEVRDSLDFDNIFTSYGLLEWITKPLSGVVVMGTGRREISESITSLHTPKSTATGTYINQGGIVRDEESGKTSTVYTLIATFPTEAESVNYSEVGIKSASTSSLNTYALIRDSNNMPTTLSVLKGERVRLTYHIHYSAPELKQDIVNIGGTSTTVTQYMTSIGTRPEPRMFSRNASKIFYWGGFIPLSDVMSLHALKFPTKGVRNGVISQNLLQLNHYQNEMNFDNGIGVIQLRSEEVNGPWMYLHFDPPIQKTSQNVLTLTLSMNLMNEA